MFSYSGYTHGLLLVLKDLLGNDYTFFFHFLLRERRTKFVKGKVMIALFEQFAFLDIA